MEKLERQLEILGLNKRERAAFLSICVFGPMLTTDIAKRSRVARTSVHSILRRLEKRGLLTSYSTGKRQRWGVPADFSVIRAEMISLLDQVEQIGKKSNNTVEES